MTRLVLDAYLPYRLSVASNKVSTLIARAYQARFGLTIPQWRLLAVLSEGEALSQQGLVSRTAMDKVTVSRAAAALAARGLVTRGDNPDDGRAVRLRLSGEGRAIVAEVAPVALSLEAALTRALGPADADRLHDLLRALEAGAEALSHATGETGED
jgi:DNA-binding MarR family transcriptional regulator